jgi:hypothetical protein
MGGWSRLPPRPTVTELGFSGKSRVYPKTCPETPVLGQSRVWALQRNRRAQRNA